MPQAILLFERQTTARRALRQALERDGHAVLAVPSIGEALHRLRSRQYDIAVCTDARERPSDEDFELLVDTNGVVAHHAAGYDLFLPGAGIHASMVMIIRTNDPQRVRGAVHEYVKRFSSDYKTPVS